MWLNKSFIEFTTFVYSVKTCFFGILRSYSAREKSRLQIGEFKRLDPRTETVMQWSLLIGISHEEQAKKYQQTYVKPVHNLEYADALRLLTCRYCGLRVISAAYFIKK